MKFRKKPVVIEAVRLTEENKEDFMVFAKQSPHTFQIVSGDRVEIKTLEGTMTAMYGDWIIKGIKGEFYSCKPDIFEASYERVEE